MKTFKNPSALSIAKCASCTTGQPLLIPGVFFMQNQNEVWKDVIGYEGLYQVSSLGRVRSLGFTYPVKLRNVNYVSKTGRILVELKNSYGYPMVNLSKQGKHKSVVIHRLVAKAFIENTHNNREVNHINGIKSDNRVENLEWCTSSANSIHALKMGLQKPPRAWLGKYGKMHHSSKTVLQFSKDGEIIGEYGSAHEAMRITGVHFAYICSCCRGEYKTAKGFIWRYKE